MLKIINLKKEFVSGGNKVVALENINMHIPQGVFAAIIGKSGSGKSTLLSMMGALDRPTAGEVIIGGKDIAKMSDSKLIAYRRDEIGFIFQNYNLVPNLSALENVMLPMEFAGIKKEERIKRAQKLLADVGLTQDKLNRKPTRLSGGEQQRVAIARALANQPKIILADEPTGNLDSATGDIIVELLRTLSKTKKTTVIAVTHDTEIAQLADHVFEIKDGKIV